MDLQVERIKPALGAKVSLDRSRIGDARIARQLLELLETHTVLVFPQIGLSDTEQLALTDSLGERQTFPKLVAEDDDAALAQLSAMVSGAQSMKARPDAVFLVGSGVDIRRSSRRWKRRRRCR